MQKEKKRTKDSNKKKTISHIVSYVAGSCAISAAMYAVSTKAAPVLAGAISKRVAKCDASKTTSNDRGA